MKKYEDVVLDINGNAIAGATVAVQSYPSGSAATVYPANTPTGGVTSVTTDSDGRFTFFAKNGRYNLVVSKSGITSETQTNVLIEEPVEVVNVDGYGAVGDDSTDDTAAIQAAEDALTTLGGALVFTPGKTYKFNTQLTKKSNVTWIGDGAALHWGGGATVAITSGTSGVLERCEIRGLKFDIGTASKGLELNSIYDVHLRKLRFASNSATNFAIDVGVNTAGGTNAEANRNSAHSSIQNILVTGDVGTVWRVNGGSSASEVVTLIDIGNIIATSVKVRGGDIAKWADSFTLSGIHRYAPSANNSGGIEINTASPAADVGVYAITINHLAVDTFAVLAGRYGLKINFADQIKCNYLFNDPAGEAGQYVIGNANAGYEITYAIAGTNDIKTVMDARTARLKAQGAGVPFLLGRSGVAVTAPLDTNDNTLASVSVPANALGPNGYLEVWTSWTVTNNANLKTLRIKYGGSVVGSRQVSTTANAIVHVMVINKNNAAQQFGHGIGVDDGGGTPSSTQNRTIDSTAAQNLEIAVIKGTGADSVVLNAWWVRLVSDGT